MSARVAAERRTLWLGTALAFSLGWLVFLALYGRHPLLYDTDAYYHLAVARLFALEGIPDHLPWLRFSTLGPGFGDKELLFHLLLAPFTLADPEAGGRLALALLDALVVAAVAHLGIRTLGWWGLALPFWLLVSATEFTWRLVRLRPELVSLLLLLAAAWAAGRGRHRLLGLLALAYALSYTAFQAFLGLALAWFLVAAWVRRRTDWGLLLYPVLGTGLGLLLHPNFPANLEVWAVQNLAFFRHQAALDVGTEILPQTTAAVLALYLGWLLGLAVLWRCWRRDGGDRWADGPADAFLVAAVAFGLLYLHMSRFALYLVPFATLAVLFQLRRRGRGPGASLPLPGRGRVPLALALVICLLVSLPQAASQLETFAQRTAAGPGGVRQLDREAFGRAVPAGARVAAPWRATALYLFWAPQGRYLNALDPVFMAVPYPEVHRAQAAVFDGSAPDVPLAVGTVLDSDHLAFAPATASAVLGQRLAADPRVAARHRGIHQLFAIVPDANWAFVLDWRVTRHDPGAGAAVFSGGDPQAPMPAEPGAGGPLYPRAPEPLARALEGYVDARRVVPPGACAAFSRRVEVAQAIAVDYELAPSGPTVLLLDGAPVAASQGDLGAVLGRGLRLTLPLAPGSHRITVLTCPERTPAQRCGFYLLERGRTAAGLR